ncbi:MAG: hypothetical protein JXR25_06760 [Pontiellaceae bacterium]|nr:hypothetical protein [Pontiellaceae bacterium]MBN2784511.1 hypothetical protein [Pontiellaceae bacterium]
MKYCFYVCLSVFFSFAPGVGRADYMVLEGVDSATITTGDLLDGAGPLGLTVNVVEISDLMISVRSGSDSMEVNVTTTSFGINADGAGDETDAFDAGELLIFTFNRDIRINEVDFNTFDDIDEGFVIAVAGQEPVVVDYADLSNLKSDLFSTSIIVPANTDVQFSTGSQTAIGLDGIELEIIPEPATCSLIVLCGCSFILIRRIFR